MQTSSPRTTRFFSASRVLGSRPGSVGVGVAGCPGCAWVWRRGAAVSLAVALPSVVSRGIASGLLVSRAVWLPGVSSVSLRSHRGRVFLRVRGSRAALRALAVAWSCPPS